MLTLYLARYTVSLAALIVLEEAGAAYELRRIDFKTTEQRSDAYLAINPKGRVPALVTERGILTETPAILAFIAQSHPAAALAPVGDPFAFARVQAFNCYLASTVHVAHAHGARGGRWADDPAAIAEMKRKAPEAVTQSFELIERDLPGDGWAVDGAYSIADPYLFTLAQWLEGDRADLARLPKVLAHRERMRARPAVARALEIERT